MSPSTYTAEEIDQVRDRARAVMQQEGMSQASAAREAGAKESTFGLWINDKYTGDNDKFTSRITLWLTERRERQNAAERLPTGPGFVMTETAELFIAILRFARAIPEIGVIVGGSGVGKTTAAKHYASIAANTFVCTMNPTTANTNNMLQEIAETIELVERSPARLLRSIGRKLADRDALLIIDEAQHLRSDAIDALRTFHDTYGIGLALLGNEALYGRIEGGGRNAALAQIFSRIGERVTRPAPLAQDVCELLDGWEISDPEEKLLLKAIAAKPGALRSMIKVIQSATIIAVGEGKPRSLKHFRAAAARHSLTRQIS